MSKDGQAAKFKRIRVHDILVMIGDEVVLGKSTKDVKLLIQKHEGHCAYDFGTRMVRTMRIEEGSTKKAKGDVDKDTVSTFNFRNVELNIND